MNEITKELLEALKACLKNCARWHPADPAVHGAISAIAKAESALAERAEREKQKPVFWYRPHSDGHGYDGPIHDSQIEPVRRESGAWFPLFSFPVLRVRIEWTIEGKSGHGEWFPSHSRATLIDYCKVMNDEYGMGSHRVVDEPAKQLLTPEQIEKADEAIREALGDASDCMRVWNAWSYGTMGPDDFWPVAESNERVAEIRNAVVAALGFKVEG